MSDLPEPLSDTDLHADTATMNLEELLVAQSNITDRIRNGMLTPHGRRELQQRLRDIEAQLDHLAESAEIEHHAASPADTPSRWLI